MTTQLLEKAAELFAERGFSGTSLQDVADAMDLSRPALYHYVNSKEAILEALVSEASVSNAAFLSELRLRSDLTPTACIEEAVRGMALRSARSPLQFRVLITSEAHLPADLAEVHERAKREVLEHLTAILAGAVEAGTIRPVDERLTAFAILGTVLWIPFWFKPEGRASAETVAEEFVRFVLDGLVRPDGRPVQPGLKGALELLREDMGYLERLVGG
jgi:AcrR family transcriptional regulator